MWVFSVVLLLVSTCYANVFILPPSGGKGHTINFFVTQTGVKEALAMLQGGGTDVTKLDAKAEQQVSGKNNMEKTGIAGNAVPTLPEAVISSKVVQTATEPTVTPPVPPTATQTVSLPLVNQKVPSLGVSEPFKASLKPNFFDDSGLPLKTSEPADDKVQPVRKNKRRNKGFLYGGDNVQPPYQ